MAEYLDDKLHGKWNTLLNRELTIWLYYRISKRLERIEQKLNLPLLEIPEKEPDIYKIKKPKKEK